MYEVICSKIGGLLCLAMLVGAEVRPNQQDEAVDKFFDRALKDFSHRPGAQYADLENTTLDKSITGKAAPALSFGTPPKTQVASTDNTTLSTCNTTKHRMQISADWQMLYCSTAVQGELKHEVTIGIEQESEYTEKFERMIKNQFIGGMEFAIGPMVKNKLTGEGTRLFGSAFSSSASTETAESVSCEVFGGTWCMWQWHMDFKQCGQSVSWNSPITTCSRGMEPPDPPPNTVEKYEPGTKHGADGPSLLLLTNSGFANSCLFALMGLSMLIGICWVVDLRRSGVKHMNLRQPFLARKSDAIIANE